MSYQSYLIFELSEACYGLTTIAVQEIVLLPEITPVAEAALGVIGILNLRGEILPILDLSYLLGQSSPLMQPTDSIIVVQWQNQRVGIVVQQVQEVQTIATEQIQTDLTYQGEGDARSQSLITGIAKLESILVMLLDPAQLIQRAGTVPEVMRGLMPRIMAASGNGASGNGNIASTEGHESRTPFIPVQKMGLYSHLSPEFRQLLQSRSQNLRQQMNNQDDTGLIPLAVLELQNEYFGIGLELVYELIDIRRLTPIPCCPAHILGNMNLRGEMLTLIDISHILNLSNSSRKNWQKAIVIRWNNSTIGIAVDEIMDVTYLDPAKISTTPVAIHSVNDEYLQGVAPYAEKMMSIINLTKVMTTDSLVVNEEV